MIDELAHYLAYEDPGLCGEFWAYMEMEGQVPAPCRCLWNLLIPKAKGHSQVDLLLIHSTGMYVVESKNFTNCHLQGDETQQSWNATYKKNRKYKIYSPYLQNEGHIEALRRYVDYPVPMKSIVAYSNHCKLSITRKQGSNAIHCHYKTLGSIVQRYAHERKPCLDDEEVSLLYQLLRPLASLR